MNYEEARVKLTNTQLNKLKSAAKNKTGTTLITKKNLQDEELLHELFLTTKQKTNVNNVFTNKMSTDIELSIAQLSIIIESGRVFGNMIDKLGKEVLMKLAVLQWASIFCHNDQPVQRHL